MENESEVQNLPLVDVNCWKPNLFYENPMIFQLCSMSWISLSHIKVKVDLVII